VNNLAGLPAARLRRRSAEASHGPALESLTLSVRERAMATAVWAEKKITLSHKV
jgi:hypothetical protein